MDAKDDKIVVAIAAGKSAIETASIVQVTRQTVYNRLKNPEVSAEVQALRDRAKDEAIQLLVNTTMKAVETLADLLEPDQPPAVRRAAADSILNRCLGKSFGGGDGEQDGGADDDRGRCLEDRIRVRLLEFDRQQQQEGA